MNKHVDSSPSNSLTTSLFSKLREGILNSKYASGEKMTESKICKEFGVSRTPVREAFKQLELEGLLEYIPNRGAFVIGFTNQDIEDIYELRKGFEVIAIQWAIERITEEELKELQEAFDLMEFYTIRTDAEKMIQVNTKFHETIYKATHSRFLEQMLSSYTSYILKTRKAAIQVEHKLDIVLKEHKRILDSFYSKDIAKGKEAVSCHLDNSQARAKEGMLIQNNK